MFNFIKIRFQKLSSLLEKINVVLMHKLSFINCTLTEKS